MAFTNYRKETSERSDAKNWAKRQLINSDDYFYESIEGCNQNSYNLTTMILERARVDCNDGLPSSDDEVWKAIKNAENGREHILRKYNFAKRIGCKFYYVLYCIEKEMVWLYSIEKEVKLCETFSSINDFSKWIYANKNWGSKKEYYKNDLPEFDKRLRNCECGCPWPTNIDCIVFDRLNQPIAVIEFQNAKDTKVLNHSNNYPFLFGQSRIDKLTNEVKIDEDLRRWKSQEIIRLQGNLRLFIVTWDEDGCDYILKEVKQITFPDVPRDGAGEDIKKVYHTYMNTDNSEEKYQLEQKIQNEYNSYSLSYRASDKRMRKLKHDAPLSIMDNSFPLIYYKFKQTSFGYPETLPSVFRFFIEGIFTTKISK